MKLSQFSWSKDRGEQSTFLLITITSGTMEHGGETNNTGRRRQSNTGLKNTRKESELNEERNGTQLETNDN